MAKKSLTEETAEKNAAAILLIESFANQLKALSDDKPIPLRWKSQLLKAIAPREHDPLHRAHHEQNVVIAKEIRRNKDALHHAVGNKRETAAVKNRIATDAGKILGNEKLFKTVGRRITDTTLLEELEAAVSIASDDLLAEDMRRWQENHVALVGSLPINESKVGKGRHRQKK